MKKKVLALAVTGVLAGAAGSANATLSIIPEGQGHILMVPYFSVQAGNSTLLNIVNTDTVRGKAVKVRFRSALDSDDIYDFQVFLSPGDMWTAEVSKAASGKAKLATSDTSCTLPANVNGEFVVARLGGDADSKARQTREGYVEILNMADIVDDGTNVSSTTAQKLDSLFYQVKHQNGVPPCNFTTLSNIEDMVDSGADDAVTYNDLTAPTATLFGNVTLINVPSAAAYTYGAVAIRALDPTRIVYSQQSNAPVTACETIGGFPNICATADGVLRSDADAGGALYATAEYDFPDLSTPLEVSVTAATTQADLLSRALLANGLSNEYITEDGISAETDWVVSLMTRRYHVAGRGRQQDGVSTATSGFYNPTDKVGPTGPFLNVDNAASSNVTITKLTEYASDGRSAKVKIGAYSYWGREEQKPGTSGAGVVISPNELEEPTVVRLPAEVSVIGINQGAVTASKVLGSEAALNFTNLDLNSGFVNGWATLNLDNGANNWLGLPAVGMAFVKAVHPSVAAGVSGVFGGNWTHRYTTPASAGSASLPLDQAR